MHLGMSFEENIPVVMKISLKVIFYFVYFSL